MNTAPATSKTAVINASSQGNPTGRRFEIKKWSAVALWSWDITVDNCAICRNHIMDMCIECQANVNANSSSSSSGNASQSKANSTSTTTATATTSETAVTPECNVAWGS